MKFWEWIKIAVSSCFWTVCRSVWIQTHRCLRANLLPSHPCSQTPAQNRSPLPPPHHHHHFFLLLFSCSCLIVNQGENNIGVFRHSMPPHSCGALSAQIQSRRRPLAQPSATMSGRLGKAQWCRLGESSWMPLQVCGKEKGMEIFFLDIY